MMGSIGALSGEERGQLVFRLSLEGKGEGNGRWAGQGDEQCMFLGFFNLSYVVSLFVLTA